MTVSYICKWCGEKFPDIVAASEHEDDCDERPINQTEEAQEES